MARILYLVHDLDDAAVWRRVRMLRLGGAEVSLAGFRRGTDPLPEEALVLGRTENARMVKRALAVLGQRLRPHPALSDMPRPDIVMARNLEMLALAVPLRASFGDRDAIPLVYEVLDIHRLLVGDSAKAKLMRRAERRLCRAVDHLIVSSPAFLHQHFRRYGQCAAPATLVENKVLIAEDAVPARPGPGGPRAPGPIRVGWFGILRCRFSLACLDAATRARPGHVRVVLRGRPALDELPDFHEVVAANPDLEFGGPYRYPDDLAEIYAAVDLAWLVDRYDEGQNSDWLLPNRLYESGLNGVPPIGLGGTQVAARMRELGIGLVLDAPSVAATRALFDAVTLEDLDRLRVAQAAVPAETWAADASDGRDLLARLTKGDDMPGRNPADPAAGDARADSGVLIVIPTLQEADHIGGVLNGLRPFMGRRKKAGAAARIVVADGGSGDGTRDIVRDHISRHPEFDIRLMDNPARLQSAGINLACASHADGMDTLVRLDAHSDYPEDFVDVVLEEARRTGADSVVVAMTAVGSTPLHKAIAWTQNSRLGNGGASHRTGDGGRFVDHGHHALIRLDAFRDVGGYDDSFSHNEDAELDLRLARAGRRIWLTTRTGLNYVPRRTLKALWRQYFRFGSGRARTVLKHRITPRIRQMIPIAVAPAIALLALAPLHPAFALPATLWVLACLAGGAALAIANREALAVAMGPVAGTMHAAWSAGFWYRLLTAPFARRDAVPPARSADAPIPRERVAVGVCTFRRPALSDTLTTLDAQSLPAGVPLTIVVADNDVTPSARSLVEAFAARSKHRVVYLHAPAGNISLARNAILDEVGRRGLRRLAFIDDDELAPRHWLRELLARMASGDADVVVGPIRAIYPDHAPSWMRRLGVHDTRPELGPDGRPIAGHSCNVLMDLASPALEGLRFDLARGASGGEDTAFFDAACRAGARLALAPAARLDEPVAPSRVRLDWLLKRRFRMGQTHGSLRRQNRGTGGRAAEIAKAAAKVAYCGAFALLTVPFPERRNANLLRGALHLGTVSSLIGIRDLTIYGEGTGVGTGA